MQSACIETFLLGRRTEPKQGRRSVVASTTSYSYERSEANATTSYNTSLSSGVGIRTVRGGAGEWKQKHENPRPLFVALL